ncbi:MAG TPA: outer membrane beta-barrel protein, partial [Terriglobales bacterium]|nr:outer membrane beta-barrel protein [Terriglobales bacterium]
VKAGIPTEHRTSRYNFPDMRDTGRWTIGPTVELRLVYGFSVEVDALYRGYREQSTFLSSEIIADDVAIPPFSVLSRTDTKVWDFPVLLKYRFGSRSFRPFVDAGYTWNHATSDVTTFTVCQGSSSLCSTSNYYNAYRRTSFTDSSSGPAGGVGVEFKLGKFKLAPEVRYMHYSNPTSNLVTIMLGFTY